MAVWSCFGVLNMYQFKRQKTELNLLFEAFLENKRLYFLTHFCGVLLYVLLFFLNFYWNPFYAGAFDPSDDSFFEKLLLSNFYLTMWYMPFFFVYTGLINLIVDCLKLKRINIFFRNLIGFIGSSMYSSTAPLMLGNLILLNRM